MSPREELTLRHATAADVPALERVVAAAYSPFVERIGRLPRPMTDDYEDVVLRSSVTVAERGGEIVGLIVLRTDEEGFVVDNVAVEPAHHGSGIGRALLEHAEHEARRAGFDSLYLYTHERATENLALYSRVGYAEYDRRPIGDADIVYLRKQLRPRLGGTR